MRLSPFLGVPHGGRVRRRLLRTSPDYRRSDDDCRSRHHTRSRSDHGGFCGRARSGILAAGAREARLRCLRAVGDLRVERIVRQPIRSSHQHRGISQSYAIELFS